MSRRAAAPVILSPAEERAAALAAQASAFETLRVTHPALFSMRVSPDDPGVHCLRTRFGVDVTQDNLLSVLLRPHAKRICDSLAPDGRKEAPTAFMYSIVKEALNNLDIDVEDLEKIGVVSSYNSGYTEETYIHKQISYLREALFNLHKLKTKTQKAAEHAAIVEANKLANERRAAMCAAAPRHRVEQMAAARAARGPRPPPEANLLGLHSAAASAGENIDYMNIERKREIAANLEGLFGGKSRTRKQKKRRARKYQKSRRNTRK
jgi:hypothetical protein